MNDVFYKKNLDSEVSSKSSEGKSASKLKKSNRKEEVIQGLGHILKLTPDHITNAKNFRDNLTDQNKFIENNLQVLNRHVNKVMKVQEVIMETNSESLASLRPSTQSLMSSQLRGLVSGTACFTTVE